MNGKLMSITGSFSSGVFSARKSYRELSLFTVSDSDRLPPVTIVTSVGFSTVFRVSGAVEAVAVTDAAARVRIVMVKRIILM